MTTNTNGQLEARTRFLRENQRCAKGHPIQSKLDITLRVNGKWDCRRCVLAESSLPHARGSKTSEAAARNPRVKASAASQMERIFAWLKEQTERTSHLVAPRQKAIAVPYGGTMREAMDHFPDIGERQITARFRRLVLNNRIKKTSRSRVGSSGQRGDVYIVLS